jgi:signal transduction histidine kinase
MAKTKILVVEDEGIIAKDIRNRLEKMGHFVPAVAVSGEEAIKKAAEIQPDLVLMDIILKGEMDGIEAAGQIRTRFNIPVIYLTAHTGENILQRAKLTEPFGYIVKPFEERELQTAIEMALYRYKMEERLRQSYEKLKELDEMKTNFINVAYHEIRSPLAPIVANVSLLEQGYLTTKQKRSVHIIKKSAEQLEWLTNQLLEVTRIDAGKVKLTLEAVSIPEILKNVLESLKPLADAKKQSLSIDVPERLQIEGHEQKIAAIFDNLVSNAIKYTGKKGRIDITVADRGEDVVVTIADTGIGISEENMPRVFEHFFMVDASLTIRGGLGLGLSIVKEYVRLHGGKVWATSELEKGSNFSFSLPKKQKPVAI